MVKFSLITSEIPDTLTKRYWLDDGGKLCKKSGGQMVEGTVEVCEVLNLQQFAELLPRLKNNQALCYGLPNAPVGGSRKHIRIVPENQKQPGAISRTVKDFVYLVNAPGVMFLDHDDNLNRDEFMGAVFAAMPELSEIDCVWYPSSSSHIWNGDTDLTGLKGQRLYFAVDRAAEIPRIGKTLHQKLWLAGYGKIVISGAGSMLERGPIDATVWQSNRLDFASGAHCTKPLEQRRHDPMMFYNGAVMAKADDIKNTTNDESRQYMAMVAEEKARWKGTANITQQNHIEARLEGIPIKDKEKMRKVYLSAYNGMNLEPGFIVSVFVGSVQENVSVEDILKNPNKYHGCKTLDPIEPEYNGSHKTGILYLKDDNPNLFSMAHGGSTFLLKDKKAEPYRVDPAVELNKMRQSVDAQSTGDVITIPLPWRRLSNGCRALRPGSMTLIAGPEKTGKSYFTMGIIRHAHELGHSWNYLPLEDDREAWTLRMLAILEEDYRMTEIEQDTAYLRADAINRRETEIAGYIKNVTENPYVGTISEVGDYVIPEVTGERVLFWIKKAVKKSRIVVVDPFSQITFSGGRNTWEQEASFIRQALGIVKASGASLILVAHTNKRPGMASKIELGASDVQGSAMLTRLAHTTILIDASEMMERDVTSPGGGCDITVESNRLISIAAARFGSGSRSRLAFLQEQTRPIFTELGFISKKKGGKQ